MSRIGSNSHFKSWEFGLLCGEAQFQAAFLSTANDWPKTDDLFAALTNAVTVAARV